MSAILCLPCSDGSKKRKRSSDLDENVKNKKSGLCVENDCKKIPSFNYETETKGLYCAEHKKQICLM